MKKMEPSYGMNQDLCWTTPMPFSTILLLGVCVDRKKEFLFSTGKMATAKPEKIPDFFI